jgi:hypothetical protein
VPASRRSDPTYARARRSHVARPFGPRGGVLVIPALTPS